MTPQTESKQEDNSTSYADQSEGQLNGSLVLPLSPTILSVIKKFPENEDVSAMQIALEILKSHPEYGGRGQHLS